MTSAREPGAVNADDSCGSGSGGIRRSSASSASVTTSSLPQLESLEPFITRRHSASRAGLDPGAPPYEPEGKLRRIVPSLLAQTERELRHGLKYSSAS